MLNVDIPIYTYNKGKVYEDTRWENVEHHPYTYGMPIVKNEKCRNNPPWKETDGYGSTVNHIKEILDNTKKQVRWSTSGPPINEIQVWSRVPVPGQSLDWDFSAKFLYEEFWHT